MKRIALSLLLLQAACLFAGIKVTREVNEAESQIITVENALMTAKFSTLGGRLISLVEKGGGRQLVSNGVPDNASEGAFRDQIPPKDFRIVKSQFIVETEKETEDEVRLVFRTQPFQADLYFIKLSKTFTIREGSSLIRCDLSISNQAESMAAKTLQYWSHNFLGSGGEDNRFFVATEDGVSDYVPSAKTDRTILVPVRGFVGMVGKSGTGVVMLPEFKRFESANSWYCKTTSSHDTLEWKCVPEKIPAGGEMKTTFSLGVVSGMPEIGGAGEIGYGAFDVAARKLRLSGFAARDVDVRILLDGKEIATHKTKLAPKAVTELDFDAQVQDAYLLTAEVRSVDGGFDVVAAKGRKILPKEQRRKSDEDNGDWQFQWSDAFETPHFPWLSGEPFKVLFLLPTNGIRDCIELKQRMPIIPTIPTIYPNSWQMSWRQQTDTMSGEKTGLKFLPQFFRKEDLYDVIVIGGDAYIPKDRNRMLWKEFPEAVRKEILERVRNGAGLVIVNPMGVDVEMDGILKSLEPLPEAFAASMDYSAAPYFEKAEMRTGMYGKGRVVAITYSAAGYIAPHPGSRRYNLQLLTQSHRFQEYQFAILARLINYARGVEPTIQSVKVEGNTLKVKVKGKSFGYDVMVSNRWSEPLVVSRVDVRSEDGEAEIPLGDHGEGRFYLHVHTNDDFGFAAFDVKGKTRIRSIWMGDSFNKGEHAAAKVRVQNLEPTDSVESEIRDNIGRVVWRGNGLRIDWDCANAVVSRHVLSSKIIRNGKVISEKRHEFYLPDVWENDGHFVSNIWSGYPYPEYAYPYINELIWKLGASYIFSSRNEECSYLFNFSNMEAGITWLASSVMFHNMNIFKAIEQWSKTGDKKYLVKPACPSNPENDKLLVPELPDRMKLWGTRHFFQLGDEMSMGYYYNTCEVCFCEYCLKGFREEMKRKYGDIAALNKSWATEFKDFSDVMPMTYAEMMIHPSPAPWVEHRLYMDKVFIEAVTKIMDRIKEAYPGAWTGPSGTKGAPAVYGGNWNFWNTRNVNYTTYYGTPRIQLSFNRDRILMCHYGYSYSEINTRFDLMEQIFLGNKGINTWWSPTYILPDLRVADIRKYYQDLTWECRNGFGEILYHSKPAAPKVAILHSQAALISNFMKQKKTDYYEKELSYAMVLEDLGIPYRFIAPEEIGRLNEFEALFLPEATAMSDAEIAAVKSFKGAVIADYEIATQNEICVSRGAGALDALFGVKTGRCALKKVKSHNVPDVTITNVCKGIEPTGGKPLYEADGIPLVIVNGKAAMLNFSPQYSTKREAGFRKLIASLLNVKPAVELATDMAVMQTFYEHGDTQYVCLLPEPHGINWKELPFKSMEAWKTTAKLRLPKAAHLYDVREGKYLGNGSEFDIELTPAHGKMLAILPKKSAGFSVAMPSEATAGTLVPIEITAENSHHVWLMTVDNRLHYRKIQSTDGGCRFTLPLALSDSGATLNVTIRDSVTGESKTLKLAVN